jgi:multidrug efflux pump subunit AcrA (membrane-fusion protein)
MISNLINRIKSFLLIIWNFIKRPFIWLWNLKALGWLRSILTWLWRILIPVLLVGLLLVPIVLTYFPKPASVVSLNVPKPVTKTDVTKKISVQATVQNSLSYELPAFQDAIVKEILVNQGDTVKEGQVLAKLDFVSESVLRPTDVLNSISTNNTEIANARDALAKAINSGDATLKQQNINLQTQTDNWNNVNQRRVDKINENTAKRLKLDTERADYQSQYDKLDAQKVVNDSIKTYQDQIKKLQDTQNIQPTTQYSGQTQINTQTATVKNFRKQLGLGENDQCSTYSYTPNSASTSQDLYSIQQQCIAAEQNLLVSIYQNNTTNSNNANANNANNRDINDLQNKINSLRNDPNYTGNTPVITDQLNDAQIEAKKQDFKSKITSREADIKQINDTVKTNEVTYGDQLKTIERAVTDLLAQQSVARTTLDTSNATLLQRIRSAQTSLSGAQNKLGDTLEDITKQQKNHTIVAKKDGIVGKINIKQGLQANLKESVFSMVSPDYQLQFTVSADNRSQLKNGLTIIADKFPDLNNIKITDASSVPDSTSASAGATTTGTANTTTTYTIKADLPKTDKYTYIQGSTINVDAIVDNRKEVLAVPSTAVSNGMIYVGTGIQKNGNGVNSDSGQGARPLISFGPNGTPRINIPGLGNGRSNSRGGNQGRSGSGTGSSDSTQSATSSISVSSTTSSSSSNTSSQNSNAKPNIKFTEIKLITVESGLDDGKNTEIKAGLNEGDYIFTIFPKTDTDVKTLMTNYLANGNGN